MGAAQSAESATQYLSFVLGGDDYGVELSSVQEIINWTDISKVPMTPPWIIGVFNLRGRVLPLIDVAQRFGEPAREPSRRTCILVLQVDIEGLLVPMGVVADEVKQVHDLLPSDIEAPPVMGAKIRVDFLCGLYKSSQGVVCLLDLVRVFSEEELLQAALSDQRIVNRAKEEAASSREADAVAVAPETSVPANDVGDPPDVKPGVSAGDDGPGFFFFEDEDDEAAGG